MFEATMPNSQTVTEVKYTFTSDQKPYIGDVYCKDQTLIFNGEETTAIIIKVVDGAENAIIINYNVDREREVTSQYADNDVEICFDQNK